MRLLDYVAQSTDPLVVRDACSETWRLEGPSDYAHEVVRCPLRYVLSDELARACTELAYSEGVGLSACLDLVRFPTEHVWIEWNAAARREELAQVLPVCGSQRVDSRLEGVLVSADPAGRTGKLRTFWLSATDPAEPMMAAVETFVDLDGDLPVSPPDALLDGGSVAIRDSQNSQIDRLLQCASFRLHETWRRYYAAVADTAEERTEVTRRSLATVAFDAPMLIALFLLIGLRSEIVQVPISRDRLNGKRRRLGRRPLLSHVEVSCPVIASKQPRGLTEETCSATRTARRLHHVRGHIVRRENSVYWRRAHWRGHLRLGCVQSRTVTLGLPATGTRFSRTT